MRRGSWLVLAAVVVGGLIASGVLSVRVHVPVPDGVSASPFWQDKG